MPKGVYQRTAAHRAAIGAATRRRCADPNYRVKLSASFSRHGHTARGQKSPTYLSWAAMISRCCRPYATAYERYGGRGITICERWRGRSGFANFLADMGERPRGRTLDRIDNEGNYEPGNCRWATSMEQRANRRANQTLDASTESHRDHGKAVA